MSGWGNVKPDNRSWASSNQADIGAIRQTLRGFRTQGTVIHALLLREMTTRFGRDDIGFLWVFFEPLLLAALIGLMKTYLLGTGTTAHVPPFLFGVIGYAPYFAFRGMINQASHAVTANMTLLYHRQIKLVDIMVARSLLQAAVVATTLLVIVGGAAWVADTRPHSLPTLVGGLFLMLLFAHGLAMLVAAMCAVVEWADQIVPPLTYISLPLSGAFFTVHSLPPSWRDIILLNPQVHFHEMMRDGMFGDILPAYYDLAYVGWWIVGVNLLGMLALHAARPKLIH